MYRISQRLQNVQAPVIPIVGEWIRQNPGTISLGQGVVYYGPPSAAADQIATFFQEPKNHLYKAVEGIPGLITRIENKLKEDNEITLKANQKIVVTAGGNMAFSHAMFAIADPGDEVILSVPYYFNHEMAITIAGCKPVLVSTDDAFQLDLAALEGAITSRTRAIVTVSPNNPTGVVYPQTDLEAVNELCRRKGIYHIHDEAYEYFFHGESQPFSPGSLNGSESMTISLYSLSKSYGFASWRIGYMVIPEHLFVPIQKIQDTHLICPTVIAQQAAIGALNVGKSYCTDKFVQIQQNREIFLKALSEIQDICKIAQADGAFYFLLKLNSDKSSMEMTEQLIREYKVAAIPGSAFGMDKGCYLRIAYGAMDSDTAEEGIQRLVRGLQALKD